MKKIRRILALLMILAMSLSVLGGCNKKTKQTMFTVMDEAGDMTNYNYEINMNLKSSAEGLDNMTVKFSGETDGEAVTMGIKVSYLYFTFNVDEFITITKDAMYMDVEQVFEALAPLLIGTDYSLSDLEEELGVELKCVRIPFTEGLVSFEKDEELSKLMNSVLETAMKDVNIENEKGTYTAKIEGVEALSKVVDAYLTGLIDNKDAIVSSLNEKNKFDEKTMKELMNLYMNEIIAALEKFNSEYDMGYTKEDIDELRKEAESEIESAIEEADLNDINSAYEDAFDEIEAQKDDIVDEIADSDDVNTTLEITNSLTGKEGSRVYECKVVFEAENTDTDEDIKISVEATMTEDKEISVKVPKNYTSMSDLIYAALAYAYESDMLDDSILGDSDYDTDIPATEWETDTQASAAGSEVVQEYDGSVTLLDSLTEDTAVIEYDKDVLKVDVAYTHTEDGQLCLCEIDDEWCYMFMNYDSQNTVEGFFEDYTEYYNDPEYFKDVEFLEMTSRDIGNVTVYEFDVIYTWVSMDTPSHERYFVVKADKGVIYGSVDLTYGFGDESTLTYEDFISAAFVNVQ